MEMTGRKPLLSQQVLYLSTDALRPNPNQPRRNFDESALRELSESIRRYGILQPLTVRRAAEGYELIAGERRLRAARLAGVREVPCLLARSSAEESALLALIENLQRSDLHYLEEAAAIARLIATYGLSQEQAAEKLGKSQSAVANKLRLLRLSPQNMELIRSANLTERHARCLLRLETEEDRINATRYIIDHDLNVSRAEQYIEQLLQEKAEEKQPQGERKVVRLFKDVRFFLNTLNRAVGVMVDAGIGATVDQQESDDGLTLTICIPHARAN